MTSLASVFVEARLDTSQFAADTKRGFAASTVSTAVTTAGKESGGKFSTAFGSAVETVNKGLKFRALNVPIDKPVIPEPDLLKLAGMSAPEIAQPVIPEPDTPMLSDLPAPDIEQPEIPAPDDSTFKAKIAAIGLAGGAALAAGLGAGITTALGSEAGSDKLAAQLGVGAKESERLGRIAGSLYSGAYGDSLEGVNGAIRGVIQNIDGMADSSKPRLKAITASVLDIAAAFDQDSDSITRAAGQLVRTGMAKNARAALDLITAGFQNGANKSDDFLDTLNEYGTQFRKLGLSGKDALGIISQGIKGGARDADIVADSFKEFSLRTGGELLKTITVQGEEVASLTTLGQAFKSAGFDALDADSKTAQLAFTLQNDIAGGGPKAKAGLDALLDGLRNTKSPLEQARNGVALFGTQYEDMGAALTNIDISKAADEVGKVGGAANKMGEVLADNASTTMTAFWRSLKTGAVEIIGGQVIPMFKSFTGFLQDNKSVIQTLVIAVGALAVATATHAAVMAVAAAGGLAAWIKGTKIAAVATKVWAAGQWILNAALSGNPIGLVVIALAALAVAVVIAYKKSDTFREIVDKAWGTIKKSVQAAWEYIQPALKAFAKFVTDDLGPAIVWLWKNVVQPTFKLIGNYIEWFWEHGTKPVLKALGFYIEKVLAPTIEWLWTNVVKPVFSAIGTGIKWTWDNVIKPTFQALGSFIRKYVVPAFEAGIKAIKTAWDTLKKIVGHPIYIVVGLINDGLIDGFNKVADYFTGNEETVARIPTKGIPHFARGGIFPGYTPGRDIGTIGVSGGEAIMRPEWTRAVGAQTVDAMNKAAREGGVNGVKRALHGTLGDFFLGGIAPIDPAISIVQHSGYEWAQWAGDLNGPDPDYGMPIHAWGPGRVTTSGWGGGDSYGNMIRINHPDAGVNTLYAHMSRLIATVGQSVAGGQTIGALGNTGNSFGPHIHFEIAGGSNAFTTSDFAGSQGLQQQSLPDYIAAALKDPKGFLMDRVNLDAIGDSPLAEMLKSVPGKLADFMVDKIKGFAKGLADTSGKMDSGVSSTNPEIQKMIAEKAAAYGWTSQLLSLLTLVDHESSFNPNAQNPDSSAYGLFQFLDTTWASVGATKTSDPGLQTDAGLKYIDQRYTDPNGAWGFWQDNGWYDKGGLLPVGTSIVRNGTGYPEAVLDPRETRDYQRVARFLSQSSGSNSDTRLVATLTRLTDRLDHMEADIYAGSRAGTQAGARAGIGDNDRRAATRRKAR